MNFLVLAAIFIFMYALNWLTPLSYGDDYLYSFVWTGEQSFFEPLPESARRLSSFSDVIESLKAHYFTHSGRTVIFLPVFFFLWQGKFLFNFFSALLVVILVLEIYWITNGGRINFNFKPARLCWIFFALWAFTVSFGQVFLWVTGALNFLFPAVLLLGFLLPYVRKFSGESVPTSKIFAGGMFFAGLFAGWTNENTICWFIILLALQLRRETEIESWQVAGLAGLTLGYALLILAPGNWIRLSEDVAQGLPQSQLVRFLNKSYTFFVAVAYQILLWFYFRDTTKGAADFGSTEKILRAVQLAKVFAVVSVLSNLIMFLAPEFPLRSTFPSSLYLIIAVTILIRLQHETGRNPMKAGARILMNGVGVIFFAVTAACSFVGFWQLREYDEKISAIVKAAPADTIVELPALKYATWIENGSMIHILRCGLTNSPDSWQNVAYARFHGVLGISIKGD